MINGILGKKIGMTQIFDEKGDVHPVTVLQAGPCVITQIKRNNKDGYEAAQIGLVEFVKGKNVTKAMQGHFGKHDLPPYISADIAIAGRLLEDILGSGTLRRLLLRRGRDWRFFVRNIRERWGRITRRRG